VFYSLRQHFTAISTSSQVLNPVIEAKEYQGGQRLKTDFSVVPPEISYCKTTISWANRRTFKREKRVNSFLCKPVHSSQLKSNVRKT
jgi:hypothetical protein